MTSPLDHESNGDFLEALYAQKREQIDAYGLHAPAWLWDEYNDIGRRLRHRMTAKPAKPLDDLTWQLLLKQFEKEWSSHAHEWKEK